MRAELLATLSLPPGSFTRRLPEVGWLVQTPTPDVRVLGEDLRELARFPLPSSWQACHWVTPDLRYVAVSERDRVLLGDREGRVVWQVAHLPWGAGGSESGCTWASPDGKHVWATAPTSDGPDRWLVLDGANGRAVGDAPLSCHAAGSHPVPHPHGRHVGLSVGEGQDGAEVYWGQWANDRPAVARVDDRSRVLIDVRPSGGEYLTMPHSSSEGSIAVHEFPTGRVVASLAASAVLDEDDWFDFTAGYVTDEMILVASVERQQHLLVGAQSLAPLGVVAYPPGHPRERITPSGRGTWMTSDYASGRHDLWRLADDE